MFLKTFYMSIKVIVTEKEILDTPNDFSLGELVRNKYWQERRNVEGPPMDDEHFGIIIGEDGLVQSILKPEEMNQTCEICGDPTYRISSEHLVGYNHMECVLKRDNEYDACVLCGRQTSYKRSTPIDLRIGYIEGAGQACDGTCRKV